MLVLLACLFSFALSFPHLRYSLDCNIDRLLVIYTISTLAVAWILTNMAPEGKHAVAVPFAYSLANVSSLVSSNLYPSTQGPHYIQSNSIPAELNIVATCLYFSCWMLLRFRNNKKQKMIAEGTTTDIAMIVVLIQLTSFDESFRNLFLHTYCYDSI